MAHKTKASSTPSLEWSVAGTLAWFSVLGRSLTHDELRQLLLRQSATKAEVSAAIKKLGDTVVVEQDRYSIKGLPVTYPDARRESAIRYKWWRTNLAAGLLRHVPYVRMVAVGNTLADQTASEDSDIDFFIIMQHGRLYLGRTLVTAVLHLAGLRRHGRKIANRVCLSFFATSAHRDFRSIAFEPYDIYLAYWITELIPVVERTETEQQFRKANAWASEIVPHRVEPPQQPKRPSWFAKTLEWIGNNTFAVEWERMLARWQQKRIAARPPNPDPDVQIIATDDMLKFHEKERRRLYRDQWEATMRRIDYDPSLIIQ